MPKGDSAKGRATVAIIGAGRLGTALAIALARARYTIVAVTSRRLDSARKSAGLIGQPTISLKSDNLGKLPPANLIFITTPDDYIAATANSLARSTTGAIDKRTVLHTSGAFSSDLLSSLSGIGFHVGSLHPLVSISDPVNGSKSLRGAFYCLEGDAFALRLARNLVSALKGHSFSVKPEHKALYHAAAVMASGHELALLDLSVELLTHAGLSRKNAEQILAPLLASTLQNAIRRGSARALTGTFARGDSNTVRLHLKALAELKSRDALAVYKLLGSHSLELAKRNGMNPATLKRMKAALKSVTN